MVITVCIGSSCHIKGSKQVVDQLRDLLLRNSLDDRVTLTGAFCMGDCMNGVCVKVDEALYSLKPEGVEAFFETAVQSKFNAKDIKGETVESNG